MVIVAHLVSNTPDKLQAAERSKVYWALLLVLELANIIDHYDNDNDDSVAAKRQQECEREGF